MTLALLISLLLCIALFVYALRVAGERNELQREVELWRESARGFTITIGPFAGDSAHQRTLRAQRVVEEARLAGKWDALVTPSKRKRRK